MEFVRMGDFVGGPVPKDTVIYFVLKRSDFEYSLMRKARPEDNVPKGVNYVSLLTWKQEVAPLNNIFNALTSIITADASRILGNDATVLFVFDDPTDAVFVALKKKEMEGYE